MFKAKNDRAKFGLCMRSWNARQKNVFGYALSHLFRDLAYILLPSLIAKQSASWNNEESLYI
jgi:hypothetical protein